MRVVLVGSKYQQNLGYIARVAKNFGIGRLYLVNPKCKYDGRTAIKYSKHAHELLEHPRLCRGIGEAVRGTFSIGTTGIWHKSDGSFFNIFSLQSSRGLARRLSGRELSLVIGRDDTGLTKGEMRLCDAIVFIGADKEYPVLNISHALAILLYELSAKRYAKEYSSLDRYQASQKEKDRIIELFRRRVAMNRSIRDRDSVVMAFRHVIAKSNPTSKELSAIAIALSNKRKE